MKKLVKIEDAEYLRTALEEFNGIKKRVTKQFIFGCVEMGNVLLKFKEPLLEKRRWGDFLKKADVNQHMASYMIRLAEYAQADKLEKVSDKVTNWKKLYMFFSVPEKKRDMILEDDRLHSNTSFTDYVEVLKEYKVPEKPQEIDMLNEASIRRKPQNIPEDRMAHFVQKELEIETPTAHTFIEGVIGLSKGLNKVITESNTITINQGDKAKLKSLLDDIKKDFDLFYTQFFC